MVNLVYVIVGDEVCEDVVDEICVYVDCNQFVDYVGCDVGVVGDGVGDVVGQCWYYQYEIGFGVDLEQ